MTVYKGIGKHSCYEFSFIKTLHGKVSINYVDKINKLYSLNFSLKHVNSGAGPIFNPQVRDLNKLG